MKKHIKLICSLLFGLILLSGCTKVEPSATMKLGYYNGISYNMSIYEFQYKGHDYLRFQFRSAEEMNIVHNPDCRKCKEY